MNCAANQNLSKQVMISYSSLDMATLLTVVENLERRAGISCWYTPRDCSHAHYTESIPEAIRCCKAMVLILSNNSDASDEVANEVAIARMHHRAIFVYSPEGYHPKVKLLYHLSRLHIFGNVEHLREKIAQYFASIESGGCMSDISVGKEAKRPMEDDDALFSFYLNSKRLSVEVRKEVFEAPVELILPVAGDDCQASDIHFRLLDYVFKPPDRVSSFIEPIRTRVATSLEFNSNVASLRSFKRKGRKWIGELARAEYLDGLATNFEGLDERQVGQSKTFREYLSGESKSLPPLALDSPLVNHLGVVCMLETEDGQLVIQHRSREVQNRKGTISASVTGGVDFSDAERAAGRKRLVGLSELVRQTALREIDGELNVNRVQEIMFLGLVREFYRNGKPEIYVYARIPCSLSHVRLLRSNARESSETTAIGGVEIRSRDSCNRPIPYTGELENRLHEAIKKSFRREDQVGEANLTLRVGLLLLARLFARMGSRD